MPAREHVLLSDAERATLFRIPTDTDELARRFTLEQPDLDLIGQRRHDRNRLGVALQFALIRHSGMTLAQVLQIEGDVPRPLVTFIARQLSLEPSVPSDFANRPQTMTDHARLIAAATNVRPPVPGDLALMIASAEQAAAATDAALPIATAIIKALRNVDILLPVPSTIERGGYRGPRPRRAVRDRARRG